MIKVFDTSDYWKKLYKGEFSRDQFIQDARSSGADAIMVESVYFRERAMYWTRMFRKAAADAGLEMRAIICESNLLARSKEERDNTVADLFEWIRISALSYIPYLNIRITGSAELCEMPLACLSETLKPVVETAKRYGMRLLFSDRAGLGASRLLDLVKTLDYHVCSVSGEEVPADLHDAKWFALSRG